MRTKNITEPLSMTLRELATSLPAETVQVQELLSRLGEPGLLTTCMFLTLPFLIPVSIPGVSTAFGLLIVLLSVGVILNQAPWLPRRVLHRALPSAKLANVFTRGAGLMQRLENVCRPRLLAFTATELLNRLNGLGLLLGGILLMAPFGLIPFSNTLPALAVLLIAAGILQRDGIFLIAGYFFILVTIAYFAVLIFGAMKAGQGLGHLFG